MKVNVYHYDAFTTTPGKGNPAGIVLDGAHLTEEEMLVITAEVSFNECAFPIPSAVADIRIRFFTPGHETPLCGHATMASMTALLEHNILPIKDTYTIETLAGVLTVQVTSNNGYQIRMQHATPQFVPFEGDIEALAASLNIDMAEIDARFPIVYGSTGAWTLCVPIAELSAFEKMKPATADYPSILTEMPKASVHPFSLSAFEEQVDFHARHFSSPYSGTIEDAITGTASGVMGAYFATYVEPERKEDYTLVVEQGREVGKDGRVIVHVDNTQELAIAITGTAVFVKKMEIGFK